MEIKNYRIRANYPNHYMVTLFAKYGEEIFNHNSEDADNPLEGNKPGTVIYETEEGEKEFPPRWYDMFNLLKLKGEEQQRYLRLLLEENDNAAAKMQLKKQRKEFRAACQRYIESHPLEENDYLITTLTQGDYSEEEISHKGRMLLDLTRNSYPVPDFCILTAKAFDRHELLSELLEKAIRNLEYMTHKKLGDSHRPLVFAIRCAMPQYIPGLMPTLLNIGVTRTAYAGLRYKHRNAMANRVYLSTLHSLCEMLHIEKRYKKNDIEITIKTQFQRIRTLERNIRAAAEDGERLLTDAHYQALRLVEYVRGFYVDNQDLILTFMQGQQAQPSLILQTMVWTIGNNESYPGVLYSRHSRTGRGRQIESYRNIFGEEIMTGDVTSQDTSYSDRNQIKDDFPAVYHFDPLLKKIETRYKSPATIEFAVESRPGRLSLFSVLQLNMSEMTGRAALLSAIDMYQNGQIDASTVTDLIKPYHLRQMVSASIDGQSLAKLQFFCKGLSVLPRTAITAVLCFSTIQARKRKAKGENVCLCQERFVPEDTITLNEVDAILSITPAAIHVVTACRGYGIPAFLDLQNYGIRMEGHTLVNANGVALHEGDRITLSSKMQSIYVGVADFKPARFTKYLQGEKVTLDAEEEVFFSDMKKAYTIYQDIVTSEQANCINDVDKLARLIRCELQNKPDTARSIVNNWYKRHSDTYINQVLESRMGDHQDQSRVFDLLDNDHKTNFLTLASEQCQKQEVTGLKAGAFMLGRFVAKPLPTTIWNQLSSRTVAFLLNEYVLYEKYLHVLEEVGEIKLARAHSHIETDGIDNMVIKNFDYYTFVPLLYSTHQWDDIKNELEHLDHQDNTHLLVGKLSQPIEQIFDMSKPWKLERINKLRQITQ